MAMQLREADFGLTSLLLAELGECERSLFEQLASLKCGIPLLSFFHDNPNTYSTVDSIAFRISSTHRDVEVGLAQLDELGIVARLDVGLTLWGLSSEERIRQCVQNVMDWQKRWQVRLAKVDLAVRGLSHESGERFCGETASSRCPQRADCHRCATFLMATVDRLSNAVP